jgi:hypothetical protein
MTGKVSFQRITGQCYHIDVFSSEGFNLCLVFGQRPAPVWSPATTVK